jgi:hypothetical protein
MNKALLILSTLSLSIIAAGSIERSYQDGMLGQVLAGDQQPVCPVIELTRSADEAAIADALQDAHTTARHASCSTIAIVEG